MFSIMAYNDWRVQLNIERLTISSIIQTFWRDKQSLSINIPHTVMCKFVLLKGYMAYIRSAAFSITIQWLRSKLISWFTSDNTNREHCYIDNTTKHLDYLVCEQRHKDFSFWWHWYAHWHKYLLLRDELKILSNLQAFAGNLLCGAVCTDCFEKCTYFCANIKDDSINAHTSVQILTMIWEMYEVNFTS